MTNQLERRRAHPACVFYNLPVLLDLPQGLVEFVYSSHKGSTVVAIAVLSELAQHTVLFVAKKAGGFIGWEIVVGNHVGGANQVCDGVVFVLILILVIGG